MDGGDGNDRIEADTNNYGENQRDIDYTTPGPGSTLKGGAGNDSIVGSHFSDVLEGGVGHDAIFADLDVSPFGPVFGNDHVDGGTGNDWLVGDDGNDVVRGGPETSPTESDHDWLLGDAGDDALFGSDGTPRPAPTRNTRVARRGTKVMEWTPPSSTGIGSAIVEAG